MFWTGFGGGFCGGLQEHDPHSQAQSASASRKQCVFFEELSSSSNLIMSRVFRLYAGRGLGAPPTKSQDLHWWCPQSGQVIPQKALSTSRWHWQHLHQFSIEKKSSFRYRAIVVSTQFQESMLVMCKRETTALLEKPSRCMIPVY